MGRSCILSVVLLAGLFGAAGARAAVPEPVPEPDEHAGALGRHWCNPAAPVPAWLKPLRQVAGFVPAWVGPVLTRLCRGRQADDKVPPSA